MKIYNFFKYIDIYVNMLIKIIPKSYFKTHAFERTRYFVLIQRENFTNKRQGSTSSLIHYCFVCYCLKAFIS